MIISSVVRPPGTLGSAGHAVRVLGLLCGSRRCIAVSGALGIQHALRGVKAAGTPVGEAAFVAAHAEEFATKVCHLIDALDELPLPTQDRWLLLQGSLQLRMTHLPWVSEWAQR
jgi:hypothetical protein